MTSTETTQGQNLTCQCPPTTPSFVEFSSTTLRTYCDRDGEYSPVVVSQRVVGLESEKTEGPMGVNNAWILPG